MLIPLSIFQAARVAAKESTRYALNGVRFRRESETTCSAATTDGRRALLVRWDDSGRSEYPEGLGGETFPSPAPTADGTFEVLIPRADALDVHKRLPVPKNGPRPILRNVVMDESSVNGTVTMFGTNGEAHGRMQAPCIEGAFPDLEAVDPGNSEALHAVATVVLSAELLSGLLDALRKMNPHDKADGTPCKLTVYRSETEREREEQTGVPATSTSPVKLEAESGGQWTADALLMPITGI